MSVDGLLHIDRLGLHRRTYVKCCICGKDFPKTKDHVYKVVHNDVEYFSCSWSCHKVKKEQVDALKATRMSRQKAGKEPEARDEIAEARKRVEKCKEKMADAINEWKMCDIGSKARVKAQKRASQWRRKLTAAQEELRAVKRRCRRKTK